MRVHVLQHVPFEGLGSIAEELAARQASPGFTRFFAHDALPAPAAVDLLIVLGGPMSANDTAELPWLNGEKAFLREAIALGIPTLGVCLGAQLIASALGAPVYRSPLSEIGWFPVHATTTAGPVFRFPATFTPFHWHSDTFDLPAEAVHLARSSACENQAFQLGRHVLGLQFHLEATPASVAALVANSRADLVAGPFVQPAETLLAGSADAYRSANELMRDVLAYLWTAA